MSAPTFIDWFAGAGCFHDGLARAGWECRGACEIDPLAREVYERAHGRPAFFAEDIERVEAKEVPEADLWVGGFPCTDVSVAGQRAGIGDGTRSGLVHAFIRLAAERRPRFLLLENVPGLLSGRTADDPHREVERDAMGEPAVDSLWFGALLGALAGAGYAHGAWRVLDGQHFGVPQRRRRVFILLGRDPRDGAAAASVLLEPEGVRGRAPARGAARAGAAAGAAGGAGGGSVVGPVLGVGPGSGYRHEVDGSNLALALRASVGGADVARALNSSAQRFDASVENLVPAAKFFSITPEGGQGADLAAVAFLDAWSTRGSCSPNQHPVKEDGLSDALDTTSPGAVFAIRSDAVREGAAKTPCPDAEGRVRLRDPGMGVGEGVAPTVDAGAAHAVFPTLRGFGHGWQGQHNDDSSRANLVRRLTPVECERLQGLADGHTCTCGEAAAQRAALRAAGDPEWRRRRLPSLTRLCRCADGPRYRLVGNGGVTHVLEWIGSRLRAAMTSGSEEQMASFHSRTGEQTLAGEPPSARDTASSATNVARQHARPRVRLGDYTGSRVSDAERGEDSEADQAWTGRGHGVEVRRAARGATVDAETAAAERSALGKELVDQLTELSEHAGRISFATRLQFLKRSLAKSHEALAGSSSESDFLSIVSMIESALAARTWKEHSRTALEQARTALEDCYRKPRITFDDYERVRRAFGTAKVDTEPTIDLESFSAEELADEEDDEQEGLR